MPGSGPRSAWKSCASLSRPTPTSSTCPLLSLVVTHKLYLHVLALLKGAAVRGTCGSTAAGNLLN
jgi:hypothetical protein